MEIQYVRFMILSYIACGLSTIITLTANGCFYKMFKIIEIKTRKDNVSNFTGLFLTACTVFIGWIMVDSKRLTSKVEKEYKKLLK